MIEIKDLLLRVNTILVSEEMKRETIRGIISRAINVDIKPENVRIKHNTVYLDIKPIYKSEIMLKRDKIFSELEQSLAKKTPGDIR